MTRQTSKSAYEAIMRNGTLSQRRRDVYEVLYKEGPLSASEVCTKLGLPRDSVSPRLSELQRLSVVREFGTKSCGITGQTVVAWDVTGNLPRGSLKTKPRRRWVLAVKADKATVFASRSEASSYAKKNRGAKLVDVVECKSKPEKPAAPKAKKESPSAASSSSKKSAPVKAKRSYKKSAKAKPKKASKYSRPSKAKKLARKYKAPRAKRRQRKEEAFTKA